MESARERVEALVADVAVRAVQGEAFATDASGAKARCFEYVREAVEAAGGIDFVLKGTTVE
jgi:hypothetical protein